ncbi:transposase [Bacillus mojavensis]|uniref:transposase n=1 Tax=Bacillus mojavensis TaxID=72360 RepID=UPI00398A8C22
MFHTRYSIQQEDEFVLLGLLIEEDHFFRKIDKYIDFPLISHLSGTSRVFVERQLEKEIYYNIAYSWLLGLHINDTILHHSTISWNRRTQCKDTTIFQDILIRSFFRPKQL